MIGGVNFQPGALDQDQQRRRQSGGSANGVQEAIKVLSLRLPKVVGAQAAVPAPLMRGGGSGGDPRIDSIVQSVLSKMFPGQGGPAPTAPMLPSGGQQESPQSMPKQQEGAPNFWQQQQKPQPPGNFWGGFTPPNIVIGNPPQGDLMIGPDGRPMNSPPGNIAGPPPDLIGDLDWLKPKPQPQPFFGGGSDSQDSY